MIKLSQKAIVEPKEENKIFIDENTEITIPVAIYVSMMRSLPVVPFFKARTSICNKLSEVSDNAEMIVVLKQQLEMAEFYAMSQEVVCEYEKTTTVKKPDNI